MASLSILKYPDPLLKRLCAPVEQVNDELRAFISDMFDTLGPARGIGLAAPQVGRSLRLFVVQIDEPLTFINPVISRHIGEQRGGEGCLSIPGVFERIKRAQKIHVAALDKDGNPFEIDAEDRLAVVIQHEFDHLQGVLMLDRMGPLTRRMAVKTLV